MEFKKLEYENIDDLLIFLEKNKSNNFIPHKFDKNEISKVINKRDHYTIVTYKENIIAYLLLRGYDEGYEIPSLGIIIGDDYRSLGLSKLFVLYIEKIAKLNGSKNIRLTVKKENNIAICLYNKLGYNLTELDNFNLVGIKKII